MIFVTVTSLNYKVRAASLLQQPATRMLTALQAKLAKYLKA
jgi:hypothetical protein